MSDTTNEVQATRKTFAVVEALEQRGSAGVTELATHLGMNKSTVHNHLATLVEEGYAVRGDEQYRLSLRFLELGGYIRSQMPLYKIAEPEVKELAEETGELANLAVEEEGELCYLLRAKGDSAVDLDTYAGMRTPMHSTALGKAILAHLPSDRVDGVLDRHGLEGETSTTITERSALSDELAEIREQGYALDREERLEGLRCVAAPITSRDRVLGAISVSAPTSRMKPERFDGRVPELVQNAANVAELNITYS
jgi:DNA-binding IclR family transcriptional regulator